MPNYSNSGDFKPQQESGSTDNREKPRFSKVVDSKKSGREKGKLRQIFTVGDFNMVKKYLWDEARPELIEFVWSNTVRSIETYIFGEARYSSRYSGGKGNGQIHGKVNLVDYGSYSKNNQQNSNSGTTLQRGFDFSSITFDSYSDAELVKKQMYGSIEHYMSVSVGDFLDFSGQTPKSTDYNFVWSENALDQATIKSAFGGRWYIDFPQPKPLK